MSVALPVEKAQGNLQELLERLRLGETITLVGSTGDPLALLVSLKPAPVEPAAASSWMAEWDALTEKVSHAWKGDKGAVETLVEMRR